MLISQFDRNGSVISINVLVADVTDSVPVLLPTDSVLVFVPPHVIFAYPLVLAV